MAKPKSSNRSVRLTDETWAWLAGEAERREMSVNGVVAEAVSHLRGARELAAKVSRHIPATPKRAAENNFPTTRKVKQGPVVASPTKVAVPFAGTFQRPVMQKKPK